APRRSRSAADLHRRHRAGAGRRRRRAGAAHRPTGTAGAPSAPGTAERAAGRDVRSAQRTAAASLLKHDIPSMSESLRDQLLKSGLVKQIREERRGNEGNGKPTAKPHSHGGKPPTPRRNQEDIDLAKAYAIRAQAEAGERKQKIQQLLDGKALNKAETELVRNFEYGGKIRRVHVDAEQLAALNAGEL